MNDRNANEENIKTSLEIIEIRSRPSMRGSLEKELCRIAADVEKAQEAEHLRVYGHGVMDADFSVHILWPGQHIPSEGSAIGLRLMRVLRDFGLLHHSVWVLRCPMNERKQQ